MHLLPSLGDLSWKPRPPRDGRTEQTSSGCPLTPTDELWHVSMSMQAHRHSQLIIFILQMPKIKRIL